MRMRRYGWGLAISALLSAVYGVADAQTSKPNADTSAGMQRQVNQIDVATRSAQDRRGALEQASLRKDSDLAGHEFTILTVLRQRVEQLGAEANQCIGEEAGFIGETKITTTVDPNLPTEDPSAYPENPIISVPPVTASPIR